MTKPKQPSHLSIFDVVKQNPTYAKNNSWTWYQNNVRQIVEGRKLQQTPLSLFTTNQTMLVNRMMPGWLYSFFYDPKGKETLPFYDVFPLVIPFRATSTHFWGINVHYLPPKLRMLLFRKLLQFVRDPIMTDRTKLMLSWRMLNNASKFPEIAPCIKCYLVSHVKSKYLKIKADDWDIAVMLPTERFKKAELQYVWRKSRKAIGR